MSQAQIVSLSGRVDVERYGVQEDGSDFSNVVLTLAESDVGEVTLGFWMLVFDVASALVLLSASGSRLISIARSDEGSCDLNTMKAAVPARELEFVTSFLLTAARDGVAPVDHVDVSLVGASGGEVELTVRVPFAAESGGPEDAARLIERLDAMPDERR